MDVIITNSMMRNIKRLAYYQIAGGLIGYIVTIWYFAQVVTITGLIILLFLYGVLIFSFSIYCGRELLKGNIKTGLRLSVVLQALQTINISILGYGYMMVSGIGLLTGISYESNFNLFFNLQFPSFSFSVNSDAGETKMGVNLAAFFALYLIDRMLQEIKHRESVYNSATANSPMEPVHETPAESQDITPLT